MTVVRPPVHDEPLEALPPRRRWPRSLRLAVAVVASLGLVLTVVELASAFDRDPVNTALPSDVPTLTPSTTSPAPLATVSPTATPTPTPSKSPTKKPTKNPVPPGPMAPWVTHVSTTDKVAFITIDDGWTRVPDAVSTLKQLGVPVTLFLTINAIKSDPGYFKELQDAGAVIEAHTINHVDLKGKSYGYQKEQICGSADQLGKWYGRRPIFFRPPFGEKDDNTLRAAHDCGIHACFFWRETVNAGIVRYQIGHSVRPGDILLMHFRSTFVQDLKAAVAAIHAAGLKVALLEDYIS